MGKARSKPVSLARSPKLARATETPAVALSRYGGQAEDTQKGQQQGILRQDQQDEQELSSAFPDERQKGFSESRYWILVLMSRIQRLSLNIQEYRLSKRYGSFSVSSGN
jgi:hypothetical protein